MKKCIIILLIVVSITLSLSITVYAAYAEPIPENTYGLPYMIMLGNSETGAYLLAYTDKPFVIKSLDYYGDGRGILWVGLMDETEFYTGHIFWQEAGKQSWKEVSYSTQKNTTWTYPEIIYNNYAMGIVTLELEENQSSFFGIDFDYSGFFGDLKVKLGKKEEGETYKIIKEWQYPKGAGHVSIPAAEIPQGNKGEYVITIYEGDTIINQYPYILNVEEKEPYCEINYPVNGQDYDYYPNVNIQYYDMGKLYIYINGEMYKQIQTEDREGIEVINGKNGLFDIGSNTVAVMDSNGQVVATVQYMVMREGQDISGELSEFEAESWVQELFNRIMNEYSMFFTYVKGIYSFLPVEIVGLVVIIMMLSVILWFTGRK